MVAVIHKWYTTCVGYTSTGVSTQKYENKQQKNKKNRKKKLLWHDRGTARARFVQSRDRNISWHAPCRDGWGGGGVEDGQAEGTTLYIFFFEQFLFWWKEAGTPKEKRKKEKEIGQVEIKKKRETWLCLW